MTNRSMLQGLALLPAACVLLALAFAPLSPALWNNAAIAYGWFQELCTETVSLAASRLPLFPWTIAFLPLAVAAMALASVVRQLFATHRLTRTLPGQEVIPIPESMARLAVDTGLGDRVRLIDSPDFYAFCFGWLRPEVCVSTAVVRELTAAELEAVLRHESWHAQRRDPLKLLVANALCSAFFFLPIVRDLARHYALEREVGADGAAVRAMKDNHPLAAALYRAATIGATGTSTLPVGAFNIVDARIGRLLGEGAPLFHPRPLSGLVSAIALVSLSLLLCVSLMAAQLSAASTCFRC